MLVLTKEGIGVGVAYGHDPWLSGNLTRSDLWFVGTLSGRSTDTSDPELLMAEGRWSISILSCCRCSRTLPRPGRSPRSREGHRRRPVCRP